MKYLNPADGVFTMISICKMDHSQLRILVTIIIKITCIYRLKFKHRNYDTAYKKEKSVLESYFNFRSLFELITRTSFVDVYRKNYS